jgi:hypothetical protein
VRSIIVVFVVFFIIVVLVDVVVVVFVVVGVVLVVFCGSLTRDGSKLPAVQVGGARLRAC